MINSWLAAIESTIRPQHLLGVASRPLLLNQGTFSNKGTMSITSQFDPSSFANSGTFNNSGTISLSLIFTSSGFSNTGTINGAILMKGMMSPGSGGVPGTFTVNGNYQQTAAGVFDEIIKSSSSNGLLDVTGLLALDPGSLLEITLQGGFDPVGDSLRFWITVRSPAKFGNGTSFMADGYKWTLTYGSTTLFSRRSAWTTQSARPNPVQSR
jgi:hypothetical protein